MPTKTIKQKFALDKSGSMTSMQMKVIEGFNKTLADMKEEEIRDDVRYLITLVEFSDNARIVYADKPLAEVKPLDTKTYVPDGMTALYDGIAMAIDTCEEGEKDTLVTIMTDGGENSSKDWDASTIKTLIDLRQDENKWGFTFFGANQDACLTAKSLGVRNALNYSTVNTSAAFRSTGDIRSAYTSQVKSMNYDVSNLTANVNQDELI